MKRWNYVYRFKYFILVIMGIFNWCRCAVERHTYHGSAYYHPNWFPDGKIVYLENYDRWREERLFPFGDRYITLADVWYVCEMDSDGSEQRRIVELPFEWDLGGSHPCVSATNDKIVLGNGSDGIWVLNRDGSGLKKIVEEGCYPDLNPEGTKVVYEKPKKGIWIYDLITGKDTCIISDTLAMMPAWSPDGEKIAYVRKDTSQAQGYPWYNTALRVFFLFTNNIQEIYNPKQFIESPHWAYDSQRILVYNNSQGTGVIINLATQEVQEGFMTGNWAPHQDMVIYGDGSIWISDLKGENIKCLAKAYTKEE